METIRRRSSLSQTIEACIGILADFIKQKCSSDDISGMILNNNCPTELRSFLWRIFLDVIPQTSDMLTICQSITKTREAFEEKQKSVAIEKSEIESTVKIIDSINEKINIDFLKSQNLKETISKLYLIWKKTNKLTKDYIQSLYILTSLVYAIYPSILSSNIAGHDEIKTAEQATARNLFYYMNNEDYFEADVYTLFSAIMAKYNLIAIIDANQAQSQSKINYQELTKQIEEVENDKEKLIAFITKADFHTKLSFIYPYLSKKKITEKYSSLDNYDPYEIVKEWYFYLFTKPFPIENIGYIWDIIFMSKYPSEINGYLVASVMKESLEEIEECKSKEELDNLFVKYPPEEISLKDIFKKAFKLQEKIHEE